MLEILSGMLAIIFLFITLATPFAITIFIYQKHESIQNDDEFENKWGSIYESLRKEQISTLFWNVIFLFKRLIFAIIAVFMREYPALQILILIMMNLGSMLYIFHTKPFDDAKTNNLEVFNEACVLGISYQILFFTDYLRDPLIQYQIGYGILIVTGLMMGVNTIFMLVMLVFEIKQCFLEKKKRFNNWRTELKQKRAQSRVEKYQNTEQSDKDNAFSKVYDEKSLINELNKTKAKLLIDPESSTQRNSSNAQINIQPVTMADKFEIQMEMRSQYLNVGKKHNKKKVKKKKKKNNQGGQDNQNRKVRKIESESKVVKVPTEQETFDIFGTFGPSQQVKSSVNIIVDDLDIHSPNLKTQQNTQNTKSQGDTNSPLIKISS
ncbi:UNKNOWN [Stylonychia lemnae]|uniref:TRP C-terminal domain-containing protein n=1 Tax=Stylonychia lemnae TaxID=5949 RepID=A0A078AVY3_STYLE|nr:UNKNOWN [Stylonychia lemnae]|eukprot:CDW86251.1 UNKNOWN [Stylonychia lemnae]